ncbi:hypothetical protein AB0873_29935, partial [Micromonospora sp. NPDC047707]|uniref:hypothetical protein n=1 Tax=Micromonospora sp. NPDC047707 TaxID=3154498 RepID=UPI0034559697
TTDGESDTTARMRQTANKIKSLQLRNLLNGYGGVARSGHSQSGRRHVRILHRALIIQGAL